jgi:hypothetical protein
MLHPSYVLENFPIGAKTGGRCRMHTARTMKHVVKHTHRSERELTYNVVLAHMLVLLDLRSIHFKFHDRSSIARSAFKV